MSRWSIDLSPLAKKQLGKLDRKRKEQIEKFIYGRLAESDDPRSLGKALTADMKGHWRYRVGSFRVICRIQDDVLVVLVVSVGDRKEVYKRR